MKKSLVLAMAMALGISATAFAANPFSDVPAGHWAYASVAKLAAAGIVDGYPDGTFKGDNLMTRYEMAQIVAKAYAKGGIGSDDKLMAEFADELDNLGVRVAKLEKKSDNVKITGQIRFADWSYDKNPGDADNIRTRLFLNGAINDDWTYTAMLENTQNLRTNAENDETATKMRRAYVTGDLGSGVKVVAGRQAVKIGRGFVIDSPMGDSVRVMAGKALKVDAFGGRFAPSQGADQKDSTYGVGLDYKFDKNLYMDASYFNTENYTDRDIYTVGVGYKFDKNVDLYAQYLKSDEETNGDDDGYVVALRYKGAKASKADSWGAYVNYYDQAATTFIDHTTEFDKYFTAGFEGYEAGVSYTLAKNIVASVVYHDFETKAAGHADDQLIFSNVIFTF